MTVKRAVAAGAIVLALAGCSSPAASSTPKSSATSKPTAPDPSAVQQNALVSEVGRLAPKVTKERVISNSKLLCTHALRGISKKGLEAAATKAFTLPADPVTAAEATSIVAAVKKNGFCK